MKLIEATMVRIYITENTKILTPIMHYLEKQAKIRGLTVFRAIGGFGESGEQHSAALLDLSLNLPLVVEFFDTTEKVNQVLAYLDPMIKKKHIALWKVKVNEQSV